MPVLIKGVEMAIRHKSRTTDGIRESFLSLDSFPLRFKNINIFLTLLGGGTIAPIIPDGSVTGPCEVGPSMRLKPVRYIPGSTCTVFYAVDSSPFPSARRRHPSAATSYGPVSVCLSQERCIFVLFGIAVK